MYVLCEFTIMTAHFGIPCIFWYTWDIDIGVIYVKCMCVCVWGGGGGGVYGSSVCMAALTFAAFFVFVCRVL